MQPSFEKTAAAMIAGTEKAIAAAVASLLKRIETLEARPMPERGEKGDPGERGPEGHGVAGAVIDRSGVLILTLSNGETRELGRVVGKDGEDGRDGADGAPGANGRDGIDGKDGPPGEKGADGRDGKDGRDGSDGEKGLDGKDGRDGFSLDAFDIVAMPDGRTIEMSFDAGDTRHTYELQFPVTIYRGVYSAGETYQFGDLVTWGGSLWHAEKETSAKPDSPDGDWKLAVKKGRDGKDGKSA